MGLGHNLEFTHREWLCSIKERGEEQQIHQGTLTWRTCTNSHPLVYEHFCLLWARISQALSRKSRDDGGHRNPSKFKMIQKNSSQYIFRNATRESSQGRWTVWVNLRTPIATDINRDAHWQVCDSVFRCQNKATNQKSEQKKTSELQTSMLL